MKENHTDEHLFVRKGVPVLIIMMGAAISMLIIVVHNITVMQKIQTPGEQVQIKLNIKKDLSKALSHPEDVTTGKINPEIHILTLQRRIQNLKNGKEPEYYIHSIVKTGDNTWTCWGVITEKEKVAPLKMRIVVINNKIAAIIEEKVHEEGEHLKKYSPNNKQ